MYKDNTHCNSKGVGEQNEENNDHDFDGADAADGVGRLQKGWEHDGGFFASEQYRIGGGIGGEHGEQ